MAPTFIGVKLINFVIMDLKNNLIKTAVNKTLNLVNFIYLIKMFDQYTKLLLGKMMNKYNKMLRKPRGTLNLEIFLLIQVLLK